MVTETRVFQTGVAWLEQRHEELLEQMVRICEIEAPTFAEQARAEYVAGLFGQMLRGNTTIDACGNVVYVYREPETNQGSLLVTAHLDTVFPLGTDVRVRREANQLSAPGIRDNSASVAMIVELARYLNEVDFHPEHGLAFVANVGEEGLGNLKGMRYLFDAGLASRWPVSAVLVLDGGLKSICYQGVSSRRLEVTIEGEGGHSWGNYGRPSAIHALGRAIALIDAIPVPATPRTTLNVGVVEGGVSVNSIAAHARMLIDMRSQAKAALDELDERVRGGVMKAITDKKLSTQVKVVGERSGGSLASDHPLVQQIVSVSEFLGLRLSHVWASTDANVPLSRGIPAVCAGVASGGGQHTVHEYLEKASVSCGARYVLAILLSFSQWVRSQQAYQ